MKNYTINMSDYIRNGIIEEVENLESNGNLKFSCTEYRDEFINDLSLEMLEQFEIDFEYYGKYNPDFTGSVYDKIVWDGTFYNVEYIEN